MSPVADEPSPQPAHAGFHWRIWFAEAGGTALLVLGALSAVALVLGDGSPFDDVLSSDSARLLVTGGLVGGCVSLIAVSPLGRLSGAHINPAVTLAFRVLGRVSGHDVVGYLVAQLSGALAGAFAFRLQPEPRSQHRPSGGVRRPPRSLALPPCACARSARGCRGLAAAPSLHAPEDGQALPPSALRLLAGN